MVSGTWPAAGYPVSVTKQELCRLVGTLVGMPNVALWGVPASPARWQQKSMAKPFPGAKDKLDDILLGAAKVGLL